MKRALVLALLEFLLVPVKPASALAVFSPPAWDQTFPAHKPSARGGSGIAFDPARHQVVLFGGTSGFPFFNDTWIWNGADWQQAHPAVSPPARADPGMAYDSTHHQIVLFGGWGPGPVLNDTWTWDGTNWTEQHP